MSGVCVLHEGNGRPRVWCVVKGGKDMAHIVRRQAASGLSAEVVAVRACDTHSAHTSAGQSTTSTPSHPPAMAHHMGCAMPSTPAAVSNAASVPPKPLNSR